MDIQHTEYTKLIAFAADELAPSEAHSVAMHTASCVECSQTVKHYQSIRRWVREDDSVDPPIGVTERAYAIFSSAAAAPQHVSDELLVSFAINDLEPADAKKLAPHINACAECSATVVHIQSIGLWLRQVDGLDPPPVTLTRAYGIFRRSRRSAMPWWRRIPSLIPLPSPQRFMMAVMVVILILSNVFTFTTLGNLVSGANAAIPGDSLYQVKREFEQMQLATTWDTAGKLDKHIAFAGYRVDETGALINLQRLVEISDTLSAFETETNLIAQTYRVLVKENASRAQTFGTKVQDALAGYSIKLGNLRDAGGDTIKPLIDHAVATSDRSQQIVRDIVNQLLTPPNTPVLAPLTPTGVARTATSGAPTRTSIPRPSVSPTPALPLRNTPADIASTTPPVVVNTAIPTPRVIVPTATRTLSPSVIVPTATRTLTATPTAKIPPGQLTKTLTPVR